MTKEEIKKAWKIFLNNKGKFYSPVVIHCDTEEKANKLLKYLHKRGFCWNGSSQCSLKHSLMASNNYYTCGKDTCYSPDVGYSGIDYYLEKGRTILEFDDIEKYLKKKKIALDKYEKVVNKFLEDICCNEILCKDCLLEKEYKGEICREIIIKYPKVAYKLMKKMLKEHKEENEDC